MSDVLVVVMLPLGDKQIETFAREIGDPKDALAFLAELRRQHAQTFARRPADLYELMLHWKVHGSLGTRQQQHEANVFAKLADKPGRPDSHNLTDREARTGSERLALALALMRRRTIRSPEQAVAARSSDAMIDASAVLDMFTPAGRETLLRRALFDPATYGRIRFHDTSVQEYLAAKRLHTLRERGMKRSALRRLFFADLYDERVVLPSMRPIAAWLALWDVDVKNELISRSPETLLSMGDPEALPLEDRVRLVRAFASAYGKGSGRGINVPIDEVRRLATPGLDATIRDLWSNHRHSDDVSELLLELLWQGESAGCNDICLEAALDPKQPAYQRVVAIRALVRSGSKSAARVVANAIVTKPDDWPSRVIHGVAADLYPSSLTLDELFGLIRRTPEPNSVVTGFAWQTRIICEAIEPRMPDAIRLRDWLSDMVWTGRKPGRSIYELESERGYLTKALAILCVRQLQAGVARGDADMARACTVANRFAPDRDNHSDEFRELRKEVDRNTGSREAAFWADVSLMDALEPDADAWHRYFNSLHDGVVQVLGSEDRPWLQAALSNAIEPDRAAVAMHALVRLWLQDGRDSAELDRLQTQAGSLPELVEILTQAMAPSPVSEQMHASEERNRLRKAENERKERNRLAEWTDWHAEVLAGPEGAFRDDKLEGTLINVYKWLAAGNGDPVRAHIWDRPALIRAFDDRFASMAEGAFKSYWRTTVPQLYSCRPFGQRNTTPYSWMMGICGLSAEARAKDWALCLTADEAKVATVLATVELNGLAEWVVDLVVAYPEVVERVLGNELDAQVAEGGLQTHVPLLQDLRYAAASVKVLLAPRVRKVLVSCPADPTDEEAAGRFAHAVDELVDILLEASPEEDLKTLGMYCLKRAAASGRESLALQWLRAGLRLDFEAAAEVVEARLNTLSEKLSERLLAALFGMRDNVPVPIKDPVARAAILGRLVRAAYRAVRVEDDQPHEGVFTPNTRDHAEEARSFLFSALLKTSGPQAHYELLAMARESLFEYMPERLRLRARERLAHEAEFAALDVGAVLRAVQSHGKRALHFRFVHNSTQCSAIAVVVMGDIVLQILEATERNLEETVTIDGRTLHVLVKQAEGALVVTREDEVADLKKTDVRLAATQGQARVVIEVKILDKRWRLAQLEHALEHQLLGQYLRHENARAGCLLLTYNGDKGCWRDGRRGPDYTFASLVKRLSCLATQLELREGGRVRLAVVGLDLRDPTLQPAHL